MLFLACLLAIIFMLVAVGVYLLFQRTLLRMVVGLNILSGVANLIIFVSGMNFEFKPPFIESGKKILEKPAADPLPQALILTAIVIGFALTAFFVVMIQKTYETTKSDQLTTMKNSDYL